MLQELSFIARDMGILHGQWRSQIKVELSLDKKSYKEGDVAKLFS